MNTRTIMHRWQLFLQSILVDLHAYQRDALALFSFAAAMALDSRLSRLCAHAPSSAQPASIKRRLLRLLGNEQLDVETACLDMASWLRRWNAASCHLVLLLDETPLQNHWRVLKVSVAWRRRAIPLCWRVYPLCGRQRRNTETLLELLAQAQGIIEAHAPRAQVELLADRGFCWPQLVHCCRKAGWDYVLRAQRSMHLRFVDEHGETQCRRLKELAPYPGAVWCGSGDVFKKSRWLSTHVVAAWPKRAGRQHKAPKEPWLLITSLRPTVNCLRRYARRFWHEESFRDEKSHGFNWHLSQVGIRLHDADRVDRLLLILALAQLWLFTLGATALSPVWRQRLGYNGRATRKLWSVFRHGWHLLQWVFGNGAPRPGPFPCRIQLTPT